jgi:glycosyltransferase involved in cell wall biosynthesis
MSRVTLVVPCFNEARRFSASDFSRLLEAEEISLLLVDDGSTDGTVDVLRAFSEQHPERVAVLELEKNRGKAEAVRLGMLDVIAGQSDVVGYIDADLATPTTEVIRLVRTLIDSDAAAVIGARVARLGADINRDAARHYLGRVFATFASIALRKQVYDTQCGAKFFRVTTFLESSLDRPFRSKWAFDVELLGRLLGDGQAIMEVPLQQWQDVAGSKLKLRSMLRAGLDLVQISRDLRGGRS